MKRALMIGEEDYNNVKENITAAPKDVALLKYKLKKLSFKCDDYLNLTRIDIVEKINTFLVNAPCDSINIIYFSGHGFQYKGLNYIVPIDMRANLGLGLGVDKSAYDLNEIFKIRHRDIKLIVIIDACRSNIDEKYNGAYSEALLPSKDATIAYATQFNTTAGYTQLGLSFFTEALCNNILEHNITIDSLFTKVRAELISSGHMQLSHCIPNMTEDVYLNKMEKVDNIDNDIYEFIEHNGDEFEADMGVILGEFEVFVEASIFFNVPLLDVYYKYEKVQSTMYNSTLLPESNSKLVTFFILKDMSIFTCDKYYNWRYRSKLIRMGEIPILPLDMQENMPVEGHELLVEINHILEKNILMIETNLPDEFSLQLSIEGGGGFLKALVKGGKARFEDVTSDSKWSLASPYTNIMDEVAKAVVGQGGRNLIGEHVEFNPIGGKRIEYVSELKRCDEEN